MIKDLKGVLTFAAFRSEPDDPAASWRNRFSHQSTALVNLGRNMVSYVTFDRRGGIKPGSLLRGEPKELLAEVGPLIAEGTDEGWCILSLNTRYVISLEHNLPRKQGSEETIKTDPRSVLHGRYERSKRYAVTHNPESNSSLLLAYEEENVRKIEGMLKEQGLKLGQCHQGDGKALQWFIHRLLCRIGLHASAGKRQLAGATLATGCLRRV